MKRIITIVLVCLSLQMSAQCWQSISAGADHSLAIKSDGTLWGWGNNNLSQLGNNTTTAINVPTQIGTATNWVKISAGYATSLALKSDGTLWACGWNTYGQVGNGITSPSVQVLTQIGTDTDWQSISAGTSHCFAIKNNGTLWAWGKNDYGQLGDNTTINKSAPIQIGTTTNWSSVSAGQNHNLALKTDGTLWAWGWNIAGQLGDGTATQRNLPTQIGNATNWQSIDAGYFHSTGIKADGTLWSWGINTNGQLGDGTTTLRNVPTQIGTGTNWLTVSAGFSYTYATKTDYSLWSWGINDKGQLGNGTSGATNTLIPTRVGLTSDTFAISAGDSHVLEKNSDGFLRACGQNADGQIGNGTNTQQNTLITISCTSLAIDDFASSELKLYPNPIKDILNLLFDKQITSVSMYNLLGQEVLTKVINATEGTIDTSSLAKGTYMVKVSSNDGVKTLKVIKE